MQKSKISSLICFVFASLSLLFLDSCNNDDTVVINPPTADFNFEASATNPLQIKFINTSASIKRFIWNFGDGAVNATIRSPLYNYRNPGRYSVTLITVGWNDVEISTTKEIVIVN